MMQKHSNAFTEGGQSFLHQLNRWRQVLKTVILISLGITLAFFVFFLLNKHSLDGYYFLMAHHKALWRQSFTSLPKDFWVTTWILNDAKQWVEVSNDWLIFNQPCVNFARTVYLSMIKSCFQSLGVFVGSLILSSWAFTRSGRKRQETKVIKGYELVTPKELKHLVNKKGPSNIRINGIPLPKDAECEHILMTGTTGSGKTNALQQLLTQIKALGHKAVIVDTNGSFLSRYYEPFKDKLLNPFDLRSQQWDVWKECLNDYDYDEFAESLIPGDHYDSFWTKAAQQLLSTTLAKMNLNKDKSLDELLTLLLNKPLKEVVEYYQGTSVSAYVDPGAEKTALGIRATLVSAIRSLKYLTDQKKASSFSMREWISNDAEKGCLYLSCLPTQREALKPLFSAWLSIAIKSLMSAGENRERRVWFIIDELASLNRIPILMQGLSEIRKYGGCMVLSFQDFHQLEALYGLHTARTLADLSGTKLIFRLDSHASKQMAELFGQQEILESSESLSFGSHPMRDGVSLGSEQRTRPLIVPSDMMQLDNFEAYLKFPRNLPATKLRFDRSEAPLSQPAFVPKESEKTMLEETMEATPA